MAKKIVTLKFKLVLDLEKDVNNEFATVDEFHPSAAQNFLGSTRTFLNEIYGITGPTQGFQNLAINSFKSVDVDVEETQ
jgi:hypothetical protein